MSDGLSAAGFSARAGEPRRLPLDELAWQVALQADIRPSASKAAVQYVISRMQQAISAKSAFGVLGLGSFEGVVKGPNDDGVVGVLTNTERRDGIELAIALSNESDVSATTGERIASAIFAHLRDQVAGTGALEVENLGTFYAIPSGPYARGMTALLVQAGETTSPKECPICSAEIAFFLPFSGDSTRPRRSGACCSNCGAVERHRTIWRFFHERTDLLEMPSKRMLHVAPEPSLGFRFRAHPAIDYVSIDIAMPGTSVHTDVTNLCFPDATFDVIYCSHVLEHIPDDRRAMRELFRVLRPGGWAVLQVPVIRKTTDEDPSVVTWEDRARRFGQGDHVRAYGPDYVDRLTQAGFRVIVDDFAKSLDRRFGGDAAELIYYCSRPDKGRVAA